QKSQQLPPDYQPPMVYATTTPEERVNTIRAYKMASSSPKSWIYDTACTETMTPRTPVHARATSTAIRRHPHIHSQTRAITAPQRHSRIPVYIRYNRVQPQRRYQSSHAQLMHERLVHTSGDRLCLIGIKYFPANCSYCV